MPDDQAALRRFKRETMGNLLEAYPHITREGILAGLGFAPKALRADVIYPIAG